MFIVARASSRLGTRGLLEVTKAQGGSGPARAAPQTVKQSWVNPETWASCPAPHPQPKLCPTPSEPPAKPGLAASTPSRLPEAVGCSILVLGQPCRETGVERCLGCTSPGSPSFSVAPHCPGEQAKDTKRVLSTAELYLDCSLWGLGMEGVI